MIFGAGDKADLDEITPLLKAISKEIFHFGPVGSGTIFKLVYNLLGASQIAALAEALATLKAAGIDLDTGAKAISNGATEAARTSSATRLSWPTTSTKIRRPLPERDA